MIAIDGGGIPNALNIAEHLLDLGYEVGLLLDTDIAHPAAHIACIKTKGGKIFEWPDSCATEERIFLDVPWKTAIAIVKLAEKHLEPESIKAHINNACKAESLSEICDLDLPESLNTDKFRRVLGIAAKNQKRPWLKDITRGERLAEIVAPCLEKISDKPLAKIITSLRQWVDGC